MRVTVCGSFGFGNAGDEAIPLALADMGAHLGVKVAPDIVGRYDEPASPAVIGIGARDAARREAVRGQPVILSGGGIIDNTKRATLVRCGFLLDKAFAPRASLLGINVESGVPYRFGARWRLRRLLRRFEVVHTRDTLSEATLRSVFPDMKVETVGDLVLWLEPDAASVPGAIHTPARYVAVVLAPRWSKEPAWRAWIAGELHTLCRTLEAGLVFVPMTGDYDDDRLEHRAVVAELRRLTPEVAIEVVEAPLTPRGVAHLLGQAELVISMRLHGCVMAYSRRRPFLGLAYHPKLLGFFRTVQWEEALLPRRLPDMQSEKVYGYRFSDLEMPQGELVRGAEKVAGRKDFAALEPLKQQSAAALRRFLACA